jgi:predicted Rossmann-fold nucleotide-binding protein
VSGAPASRRVCVYCASSARCAPVYHDAARRLGGVLAAAGFTVVYGGGATGSMGAVADGELEWGHDRLTELHLVDDMRTRKHEMLSRSDGVVALPGGSGTLEELLEAISLKRLGIFLGPIVLVNTRGFFEPLLGLLEAAVAERFMDERHLAMWQVVKEPEQVPAALAEAPAWSEEARRFARP